MPARKASALGAWLWVTLVLLGCVCTTPASTEHTPNGDDQPMDEYAEVQTDIATLSEMINLEHIPLSATWQVVRIGPDPDGSILPGPSDYKLVAVLVYEPAVVREIGSAASTVDGGMRVDEGFFMSWYPQSVRDSFVPDGTTGFMVSDVPIYDAEMFLKSPWSVGRLFSPDDETIFLYLTTM